MNYFFDTSALVKLYHNEKGSDKVLGIYKSRDKITISELARVEFYSTIYRKYRDEEIELKTLNILLKKFDSDSEDRYEVLNFSPGVTEQAQDFISKFGKSRGIRTLDSIQLSFFEFYCEKGDVFVCADVKLVKIAKEAQKKVLEP
jgi:predicted nucleic acid-binding protein